MLTPKENRIFFALLAVVALVSALAYANSTVVILRGTGGGTPSGQAFSDNFNRSNSTDLGSDWSEEVRDWSIESNKLKTSGSGNDLVLWTTNTDTVDQYCVVTIQTNLNRNVDNSGCVLRGDPSGDSYFVGAFENEGGDEYTQWDVAAIGWYKVGSTGGLGAAIESCELGGSWAAGDTIGAEIEGTGNNTIVSVWKNPGARPWGSASCTFTANPSSPLDTNKGVGVSNSYTTTIYFDDWGAGDQ